MTVPHWPLPRARSTKLWQEQMPAQAVVMETAPAPTYWVQGLFSEDDISGLCSSCGLALGRALGHLLPWRVLGYHVR